MGVQTVTFRSLENPTQPYAAYAHQQEAHGLRLAFRFLVLVWHRRAGKTVFAVLELVLAALAATRPASRFGYVAPLLSQAKTVSWEYLKHFARGIPGVVIREAELAVDFPNGARVRLFGADNPDAFRGQYFDGIVLDEVAQMKSNVWGEILRPALMDRQGWALFIGTPNGINLFQELFQRALKDGGEWKADLKRWSDTDILKPDEVAKARKEMSDAEWAQEMDCDFAAAVVDALIKLDVVLAAQARKLSAETYYYAAKVLGVDAARMGDDRTAITLRQGRLAYPAEVITKQKVTFVASAVARVIEEKQPDATFVDVGGVGAGVYDILVDLGYRVIPVDFAGSPDNPRYQNKRAEMWDEMAKWLELASIPNDPALATDLIAPKYSWKNVRGKMQLESKEDMKKRGIKKSPDLGDSLACTFFAPVVPQAKRGSRSGVAKTQYDWRKGPS